LGQKGREYIVQNFSRARTAEKYIEVLRRVVKNPPLA
jgi:glycosyltransferase involved in cell wall biosynthesis